MALLGFRGADFANPINRIPAGRVAFASNVRSYGRGMFNLRNLLTGALYTLAAALHSLRRLNDSTPNGPSSGYTLINGAGTVLSVWNSTIGVVQVATGMSGNPVSIIPFRPNASVQPWAYIGDSSPQGDVTLDTEYLGANYIGPAGTPVDFISNGMCKIRSDGRIYKSGIEEPQTAPIISTANTSVTFGGVGSLDARTIPWTNYASANSSFDYGETEGFPNVTPPVDGLAPFIIDCLNATSITITALANDGTVVVNGTTNPVLTAQSATRVTPGAPGYPGQFIQIEGTGGAPTTASYVVGAFTDGAGNVIPVGQAPLYVSNIVDVGLAFSSSTPIPVPYGAVAFQVGLNSIGNTFTQGSPPNSGLITFEGTVTTNALPAHTAILGTLTASYYGDSPTSGPTGLYIWKNPSDPSGSGPTRSITDAVGTTNNNSFIFDATFGTSAVPAQSAGIPGPPGVDMYTTAPSDITVPMEWTTLTPESVASGSEAVFQPAIQGVDGNTAYQNFNFCLYGNLYIPAAGNYTFVLTYKDDVIWGIGGGATLVSASADSLQYTAGNHPTGPVTTSVSTSISDAGQTITVVNGYPLLPRATATYSGHGTGGYESQATVVMSFPEAGIYPIELDYDFWYHSGRILLLQASATAGGSPTIIAPLPASVRQEVQYRYVYRSSATGAQSNPSPESAAETIPVVANTITSYWSNDPQVDVVDYYRIDSVTASFTYVATGPNDGLFGGGTLNTPITDSLTDTELGDQLLSYDNFEPFPSIDLPQKGIVNVAGGVITWVSGGAIGGTATGFNPRWLAGTEILIGSPTSLAYTLINRPVSNTITIPEVPNGTNLAYEIPEPILAAQPLAYLWGPTDNINFTYGVGDPLRPGTMYWCAGSNLDAAPDTNQEDITDPSETLVNGAITGGLGVVFSIKRAWLILPNFFNATATAEGTTGSTWSLQESSITRGLYIPRCVCVSGGGLIYFRVDDGIHISARGSASKSITDEDLYPLFPHETQDVTGSQPVSITRNGITIYPPDDTKPQLQKFSWNLGYMYWDYVGTDGNPHTMVFDEIAMGWVWDITTPPATIHSSSEGLSQQGVLVGCSDGSVRQMSSSGTETVTAIVLTGAIGGRGWQHVGECVLEYTSTAPITLTCIAADSENGSYGPPPITIPSSGGQATKYFFRPGANKWKLMWFQFSSTTQFSLYLDGTTFYTRDWGSTSAYRPVNPFGSSGGEG
jgi:hypothetical protein